MQNLKNEGIKFKFDFQLVWIELNYFIIDFNFTCEIYK